MAVTRCAAANPALATSAAADSVAPLDADGGFYRGATECALVTMNADKMTAQVMFATEGPAASTMRADMRLKAIRVMSRLVSLQIVCAGKC